MPIPYLLIDAFTDRPFAGNPAAVVPLDRPADASWMQTVAAEFNLSETAFTWPEADGLRLRWFTPTAEVDLCGHATLAAAQGLWSTGRHPRTTIRFLTRSGVLTAEPEQDRIVLDFPAKVGGPAVPPPGLIEALGIAPVVCAEFGTGVKTYWLVELATAQQVLDCRPDLHAIGKLPLYGVIITASGNATLDCDVVSRFFAPSVGVPEDPVTGSAHCALGPWWAAKLGRTTLVCRQVSSRGGTIFVEVQGDRVRLAGHTAIVAEGRLLTEPSLG